eukprot:TRINITY_DN736_c0_g2_i2.p1 TRINITY_DN736_c0_g2~~TRINITY_DN736_c0_g2_i2.p1  ORF type:complete len:486 (-),score=119.66 TRINITY_DN736_c0_g2_i2:542-1999(-)
MEGDKEDGLSFLDYHCPVEDASFLREIEEGVREEVYQSSLVEEGGYFLRESQAGLITFNPFANEDRRPHRMGATEKREKALAFSKYQSPHSVTKSARLTASFVNDGAFRKAEHHSPFAFEKTSHMAESLGREERRQKFDDLASTARQYANPFGLQSTGSRHGAENRWPTPELGEQESWQSSKQEDKSARPPPELIESIYVDDTQPQVKEKTPTNDYAGGEKNIMALVETIELLRNEQKQELEEIKRREEKLVKELETERKHVDEVKAQLHLLELQLQNPNQRSSLLANEKQRLEGLNTQVDSYVVEADKLREGFESKNRQLRSRLAAMDEDLRRKIDDLNNAELGYRERARVRDAKERSLKEEQRNLSASIEETSRMNQILRMRIEEMRSQSVTQKEVLAVENKELAEEIVRMRKAIAENDQRLMEGQKVCVMLGSELERLQLVLSMKEERISTRLRSEAGLHRELYSLQSRLLEVGAGGHGGHY